VTLTAGPKRADHFGMGRSAIGLFGSLGMVVGGYVPVLWGASSFSLQSLLFGAIGGVAGIWAGARIAE